MAIKKRSSDQHKARIAKRAADENISIKIDPNKGQTAFYVESRSFKQSPLSSLRLEAFANKFKNKNQP